MRYIRDSQLYFLGPLRAEKNSKTDVQGPNHFLYVYMYFETAKGPHIEGWWAIGLQAAIWKPADVYSQSSKRSKSEMNNRGPARFHWSTPNKRCEPVSSIIIMAGYSLFNRMSCYQPIWYQCICYTVDELWWKVVIILLLNGLEQPAIFTG